MHGDQLELLLETDGEPTDEALELLEALSKRRRYFRLKSGEYLDLSEYADWQETAANIYEAAVRDGSELNRDYISLRAYRACYLSSMLENSGLQIEQEESVRAMSEMLNGGVNAEQPTLAPGLSLREYQIRGYEWMVALDRMHMGGILADDMGLGKTLQVITVLLAVKNENPGNSRPALIVTPASLVYNWREELAAFAPSLAVSLIAGTAKERAGMIAAWRDSDVLVTSYDLLKRDISEYEGKQFRFLVADEAQYVKNRTTAAAKSLKLVKADTRFALTGTPIENRLGELWSIFDYLMPGLLYSYDDFRTGFEAPIMKSENEEIREQLRKMVTPFILRRKKADVLKDLPDKLEEVRYAHMESKQQKLYDGQVVRMRKKLQSTSETDFRKGKIEILAELTHIRQICCDPSLMLEDYDGKSAKRELCLELIDSLIDGDHRALIFSQFTSMLEKLEEDLKKRGIEYYKITGATPKAKRMELVKAFNEGTVPLFLISLKAGGTGLNLTGADVVIHYDPWWNTAVQDQATDRAHRIGQTKVVNVYKLIVKGTIEEKIVEMQQSKQKLADDILSGEGVASAALSREDLLELLA
jgi:SNF2 family DNA or RNA helicase